MKTSRTVGQNENRRWFPTETPTPPLSSSTPILSLNSDPRPLPRQLIALAFLSEMLPVPLISQQLARALCDETPGAVVLVRFARRVEPDSMNDGTSPVSHINGEFHMPACLHRTEAGFHLLTVDLRSDPPSPAGIASLVSPLRRQFRHVLLEVPASERSAPWLTECLVHADLSYLFLSANPEAVAHADQVRRGVQERGGIGGIHIKSILCLAEGQKIDGLDLLTQRAAAPIHLFVRGCPTREAGSQLALPKLFHADLRRLAREISGRLVGLALSSGAAKGFAHIGVIQVLEENGIEVDVVAGASMGAYVGSLWANGNDGTELERLARELESRWALWSLVDPVFPPRQGFLRGNAVKRRLMRSLGHARFADLVRPLRVVASNLATLERVVFSGGEVAAAVHASSAIPGICVPVTIDGETYIDGGIVDPLPVDVLLEMGISRVIAVDVIPTPDRIRRGLQVGRESSRDGQSSIRKLFNRILPVNQQLNYFARGNLFEILMRSISGAQIRVAEASCRLADVVLRPDICDDRWLDYRNPGKFIKLGREEAERHLEAIQSLVARKEIIREPDSTPEALAAIA